MFFIIGFCMKFQNGYSEKRKKIVANFVTVIYKFTIYRYSINLLLKDIKLLKNHLSVNNNTRDSKTSIKKC